MTECPSCHATTPRPHTDYGQWPNRGGLDMSRDRRIAALVARGVTEGFAVWLGICTPGTLAEIEGLSDGTLKFLSNLDHDRKDRP